MQRPALITFVLLGVAVWCLSAEDITFAAKPRAVAEGTKVRITFELSEPTDVAVGIVNEKSVVIKHIAGGMLGPKAPKPLKPDALTQTLYWDRTDDLGRPVPEGTYTVQVRAGMKPVFERIIGYEPRALSSIRGLAVGPGGELFVMNASGIWKEGWKPSLDIPVFSREFTYLRTIMPYPGDLPLEQIKGVDPVKRPDGLLVPRLYHGPGRLEYPSFGRNERFIGRAPGQLPVILGDHLYMVGPSARLVRIRKADGSTPEPFEVGYFPGGVRAQLTASPDGKWLYAAVGSEKVNAVFRLDPNGNGKPEVFVGDVSTAGNDNEHLKWPQGIAVDADGNVLVSDWGNNRVAVFSPQGTHTGQFKVDGPVLLAVDRKRGTIFVLSVPHDNPRHGASVRWINKKLLKIRSWKKPEVVGELSFAKRDGNPYFALDDEADPPILWMTGCFGIPLSRIVVKDPNGPLSKPEPVGGMKMFPKGLGGSEHLAVNPATERLYVREFFRAKQPWHGWHAFDGKTGEPLSLPEVTKIKGSEMRVGPDGFLYCFLRIYWGKPCVMLKYDPDGKPAPFTGSTSNRSELMPADEKGGAAGRAGVRGFDVGFDGKIYVMYFDTPERTKYAYAKLGVMGPDGKMQNKTLFPALSKMAGSPRVDREGNIYVMEDVLPEGAPPGPPPFGEIITKKIRNRYKGVFGSIVKFPPSGGAIYLSDDKNLPPPRDGHKRATCSNAAGLPHAIDNAVWIRPYAAPVYGVGGHHWCWCFTGRFDLDRYGRLFVPVAPARRIRVLDTAGNHICSFGRYGSIENVREGSSRKLEGIPINWGSHMTVSDHALYIADTNNRCVVKVRLDCHAEAECQVP